uniref:Uncharacterized protein n=1 Tax=Rhizophora mucronata TaxID=61149 RepID=A0A2P2PXC7_RHIMU
MRLCGWKSRRVKWKGQKLTMKQWH